MYAVIEALLLVVLFGFWFATGFGRTVRTPYWQGMHYDLVAGRHVGVLPRGQAGAQPRDRHRRPEPRRPPRAADPGRAAGTPDPATRSSSSTR